jgi:protein-tyrosine phosphatase
VRIIGAQVMKPRGLIGLAQDTLDCGAVEMREAFEVLADDASYPIVLHCTQGKDRTGLIIMMLLFLTDIVPVPAISADYVKSEPELVPEQEERLQEILAIGLDEEYAKCPPGFTEAIKTFLDTRYGGTEAYLLSIGLSMEKIDRIRNRLIV